MLFSHTSTGNAIGLLLCFLASTTIVTPGQSEDDFREDTNARGQRPLDNCINRILSNSSVSSVRLTVGACNDVLFPVLCSDEETSATISNHWMISTQSDCMVAYSSIDNSSYQQHQQISNCHVIYQCWIVYDNKSICLYLDNSSDAMDHNRLSLASMKAEDGVWTFLDGNINVFTLFSRINRQLPFFTGLYEGTRNDGETATFVIGNNARLSKVIVPLNGDGPSHRQRQVCRRKIIDVKVTSHLVITCDDQTIYVELLESWHDFNISYTTLHRVLRSGLSKSYIFNSGEVGMIVVANLTSDTSNISYWLAYKESPDLERCINISATFTDGLLFEDGNSSVLFFAILDGNLTVINELCDGIHTVATDVCYQGDCYLHHTEHLLYVSDQNRTTVVNPRTYEVITNQFADVHDVLPVAERALQQCEDVPITPIEVVSTPTIVSSPRTSLPTKPPIITTSFTVLSSTKAPPLSTTDTVQITTSTNAVTTQGAKDTTIESETNKTHIIAGVGAAVAIIVVVVIILTATLILCCLKKKRGYWQTEPKKCQTSTQLQVVKKDTLPMLDLTHSPMQVLRHHRQGTCRDNTQDCLENQREQFLVASSHA